MVLLPIIQWWFIGLLLSYGLLMGLYWVHYWIMDPYWGFITLILSIDSVLDWGKFPFYTTVLDWIRGKI